MNEEELNKITEAIIGAAIEVHRALGPGLLDLLVDDAVIVEIKAVDQPAPIHEARLLSYLKLSGHKVGSLINFNVKLLKDGIRRFANGPLT